MKKQGLERLLAFLALLRERKIPYRLDQQVDDAIEVSFALVGRRVEVEFFVDHIEFSCFSGQEGVETDEGILLELMSKWGD